MIRHWVTRDDAPLKQNFVKRFDPRHFTVDFPRGAIASAVLGPTPRSLSVAVEFLRRNDLVGLIYTSEDGHVHPVGRRETSRDYRRCKLRFRWRSVGLPGMDAVNGPTLTIEGRDAAGASRTWYVRLWNYAAGTATDAVVELDFDHLVGGFNLVSDADPVFVEDIDRLFFSLVPEGFDPADESSFDNPREGTLELSELTVDGSGSVLSINDAMVPDHALRMCTAYDDLYNLVPERVVKIVELLGYRKLINHYVGMSHHQRLTRDGLIDAAQPVNSAAAAWHRAFVRAAAVAGFEVIFSLSFEILNSACPEQWKQRTADGQPALTGYEPPSSLISPANGDAVDYLSRTATAFAAISQEAGLRPRIQIGEAWWWIAGDQRPCFYDEAARAALGGNPITIADVRGPKSGAEIELLDAAGRVLARATDAITAAVRAFDDSAELLLLVYTPSVLAPDRPELYRANLPYDWAAPAFDVLQLEDYEWLTSGSTSLARGARGFVDDRLGYSAGQQHYFAGFASAPTAASDWRRIAQGAQAAFDAGIAEVLVWALPQVMRDRITFFDDGDAAVNAFEDVVFPLDLGAEASVVPGFSTTVLTSASGHEYRNVNWSQARLQFDAGPGVRSDAELKQLIAFFRARRGSAQGFRFRDPYDHSSNAMTEEPTMLDEQIGVGDGIRTSFALVKNYGDGEQRRITRPVSASVRIAVGGVEPVSNWQVAALGEILFDAPPAPGAIITAGFLFDVPVRFASDQLEINRATFLAGSAPSVPLVEIRELAA